MARLHVYIMTRVLTTITHAEPGYYADGRYGIRIENVVVVREAHTLHNFGDKGYLRFEHVTLVRFLPLVSLLSLHVAHMNSPGLQCPMGKNLINVSLLNEKEKEWLNAYHEEILEKVSPLVQKDERALKWLQRECSPI